MKHQSLSEENPGLWRRLHLTKMDVDENNNAAPVRSASSRDVAAVAASAVAIMTAGHVKDQS